MAKEDVPKEYMRSCIHKTFTHNNVNTRFSFTPCEASLASYLRSMTRTLSR